MGTGWNFVFGLQLGPSMQLFQWQWESNRRFGKDGASALAKSLIGVQPLASRAPREEHITCTPNPKSKTRLITAMDLQPLTAFKTVTLI